MVCLIMMPKLHQNLGVRTMRQENVNVTSAFALLMSLLFGIRNYQDFAGTHSLTIWKRHLKKLINTIRRSIIINITAVDDLHRKELIMLCDRTISAMQPAKTKDEVNLALIEGLVRLLFGLLGELPNHLGKNSTSNDKLWELDKYRTVVYRQTSKQKVRLICEIANNNIPGLPTASDLWTKWDYYFKRNDYDFINWFKQNYCDIYADVF